MSTPEKSTLTLHDDEERQQMLDADEKLAEGGSGVLPSPVSASASKPAGKPKLSTTIIIPIWIVLSSSVIIYNNYLYNTLSFRFPVFLVTWHLTFAVSSVIEHMRLVPFPSLCAYLLESNEKVGKVKSDRIVETPSSRLGSVSYSTNESTNRPSVPVSSNVPPISSMVPRTSISPRTCSSVLSCPLVSYSQHPSSSATLPTCISVSHISRCSKPLPP